MSLFERDKPTIHVMVSPTINKARVKQLFYGMEEEEVPFLVTNENNDTAINLAYEAAGRSRLGVGVGIGSDQLAVLHYEKLKKDKPLYQINLMDTSLSLRALGTNAARLVKGIPFKELEIKKPVVQMNQVEYEETPSKEKIISIIKKVLSEME